MRARVRMRAVRYARARARARRSTHAYAGCAMRAEYDACAGWNGCGPHTCTCAGYRACTRMPRAGTRRHARSRSEHTDSLRDGTGQHAPPMNAGHDTASGQMANECAINASANAQMQIRAGARTRKCTARHDPVKYHHTKTPKRHQNERHAKQNPPRAHAKQTPRPKRHHAKRQNATAEYHLN